MRKKVLNGKRVMALALALSLTIGEAGVAVAAPVAADAATEAVAADAAMEAVAADAAVEEAEEAEAAEQEADTTVSANEGEVTDPETEQPEVVVETEEDIDVDEKVDGTLSKVIGVKAAGRNIDGSYSNENGVTVMKYVSADQGYTTFEVAGKVVADKVTGLYSQGGKLYGGAYYDQFDNVTTFTSGNEVAILPKDEDSYYNKENGLYSVNGKYYEYLRSYYNDGKYTYYYYVNRPGVVPAGAFADRKAFNKAHGRYTRSDAYYKKLGGDKFDYAPDYYEVDGKLYEYYNTASVTGKSESCFYVYDQIIPNAERVNFTWNMLTKKEGLKNAAGQELKLGYEVEVDGALLDSVNAHDTAGGSHYIQDDNTYEHQKYLEGSNSVSIRVRGLYYHWENKTVTEEDGSKRGGDVRVIDAFGEWSEPVSYKNTARKNVSAVSSLTAAYIPSETVIDETTSNTRRDKIRVNYSAAAGSTSYTVYEIAAKKPLSLTAANFADVYNYHYDAMEALGVTYSDLITDSNNSWSTTYTVDTYSSEYPYYYFAVVPNNVTDDNVYVNMQDLRTITTIAAVTVPAKSDALTQVTNLRIEKRGGADERPYLVWDKTDKDIVIYAYEAAAFPANYTAKVQDPSRADEDNEMYDLIDDLSDADKLALKKVKMRQIDSSEDRDCISIRDYGWSNVLDSWPGTSLEPGRTYYFVAYTYDNSKKLDNQAPIVYKTTEKTYENGIQTEKAVAYSYTSYYPMSKASNVVAYKYNDLSKPTVSTAVTKNSVKLTVGNYSTGYEVYRKNGKKFKKIATMTDDVYTDEGLKNGTSYTYKVRSYYYNRDTKEKYYSKYRTVTVKTADAANISVNVTKASKSSAKISWTKVPSATKYEIYRSNASNTDPKVVSKKFSASGNKDALSNARYELVKTLAKSKKSYTDKKLTAGESYAYIVVAYYKAGSKTEYVSAGGSVVMEMDGYVQGLKGELSGSKAVITWDKDKFASKYELEYTIKNVQGIAKTKTPVKVTTKKNKYTIKGLGAGETVDVRIRSVGKGGVYSDWSGIEQVNTLAPVKGIKAVAVTKKTADGKTVNGVKITWKAVKGAKYYKVYRSTTEGTYDADKKLYELPDGVAIAKEANDDFVFDESSLKLDGSRSYRSEVGYKEYEGIEDSVVGTTAYDYADFPAGVTYYYTVQAYGEISSGCDDSSVYSVMSSKAAKVTAAGLNTVTLKNSKKGKVTVTFNTVSGATKYTVYRATKKNGKYTKVTTVKVTKKNKNKKTLSYTGKAAKKKTYYYKVTAEGTNGLKADMKIESAVKSIKVKK